MAVLDRFSEIKESSTKGITPAEEIINNLVHGRKTLTEERERLQAELNRVTVRIEEINEALNIIENGLGSTSKQASYGTN